MGAIGGMLGTAGGVSGTGISGPKSANIQGGTTAADVTNAQAATGNSLAAQQGLLAALQNQNGIGQQNLLIPQQQGLADQLAANNGAANMGAAYNAQTGFNNQLGAANGIGTQTKAITGLEGLAGRQMGLEGQYQNIANGVGPNPAQAALHQATAQNVANQAALMAGQRGASANAGLLARQAAQQGAATQQQAVNQGATLQAQQQLNALAGLSAQQQAQAGTQQAIGGLGTTQAGMQQTGIAQQGALAGQQIAAQQAQQAAMANQANTVANQQIAGTSANTQANLSNQGQLQGALAGINNANVSNQGNINAANAGLASTTMQGQQKTVGGLLNSAGSAIGMALAKGGEVKHMAEGGYTAPPPIVAPQQGPSSSFGQFLTNYGGSSVPEIQEADRSLMVGKPPLESDKKSPIPGGDALPEMGPAQAMAGPDAGGAAGMLSEAGPALALAAKGGLASSGGHVKAPAPKQKAVKAGDDYANDKIPAKLSEGEIVLPRSVTMSDDPIRDSADFVRKVLAKRKAK